MEPDLVVAKSIYGNHRNIYIDENGEKQKSRRAGDQMVLNDIDKDVIDEIVKASEQRMTLKLVAAVLSLMFASGAPIGGLIYMQSDRDTRQDERIAANAKAAIGFAAEQWTAKQDQMTREELQRQLDRRFQDIRSDLERIRNRLEAIEMMLPRGVLQKGEFG